MLCVTYSLSASHGVRLCKHLCLILILIKVTFLFLFFLKSVYIRLHSLILFKFIFFYSALYYSALLQAQVNSLCLSRQIYVNYNSSPYAKLYYFCKLIKSDRMFLLKAVRNLKCNTNNISTRKLVLLS